MDSNGDDERPCFYLCDATGAVDLAFDLDGAVVWSAERTVYGDVTPNPGAVVDVRVRFAGQHYDEDLGFVYNRMRWYDPRTGHYLSHDPLTLDAGTNPRAYVPNPTFFVDPMGESKKPTPLWPHGKTAPAPVGNHPLGNKARPARPETREDLTPQNMSQPGHFATNGTKETPGFVNCPADELDAAGHTPDSAKQDQNVGKFSKSTRRAIDNAGKTYGCHNCGSKNPEGPHAKQDKESVKKALAGGTHFVPDHIAPAMFHTPRDGSFRARVAPGAVKLFPHCQVCARLQGNRLSQLTKSSSENAIRKQGREMLKEGMRMKAFKKPT